MAEKYQMEKRRRKRAGGLFILLLTVILSLVIVPSRVSAHAFLLRTEPADGLVLADAPKQMRFWFSEPLEIDLTTITLHDGDNNTWELSPYLDANDPSVVVVDLPDLPPSAYRVTWRTVSDEDLHLILGFVVFGIGQSVTREWSGQMQTTTPFAEVVFHWIGLLSFAALIGALVIIIFLLPAVQEKFQHDQNAIILSSLQSRMLLSALWFCVIVFLAGLSILWNKFIGIGAQSIQEFIGIDYVRREFVSESCLIVIALSTLYWLKANAATQKIHATIRNLLLFSCASLWAIFQSMNSHAAAFNDFSPARVIAYAFHILGAGLWMGGQIALIFLVAPRLRMRNEQYAVAREIYARFGAIAAIGVALLVVTGIYSAGQQVASLDALLVTDYGRALILKTAGFVLAGWIGLSHASHFHPKVAGVFNRLISSLTTRPLFGKASPVITLRIELIGGVAIFLLAAYLGSTPPARGPEFEAPAQPSPGNTQPASASGMADDLLVNFSIKPNQPGQNFITIGVFNTRRPVPAPIEQVVVKFLPPGKQDEIQLSATLSEKDGNHQISTGAIDFAGDWTASVVVHRTGLKDAVLELPWTVMPFAPITTDRPGLISNRPLAPFLTMTSLLLSVLIGGVWLALGLRHKLLHWTNKRAASVS